MCSHRQFDFASCLVYLFFYLCHIVLVGKYLAGHSGAAKQPPVRCPGNFREYISEKLWVTLIKNSANDGPGYCRNCDPGFFQAGHVLYDIQTSDQPFSLSLPNKCREVFPTMPNLLVNNQVITVKRPIQNDHLASISCNGKHLRGTVEPSLSYSSFNFEAKMILK